MRVSSSPPPVAATWTQDLDFSGEVTGHMSSIVPDTATITNACTGAKPRIGQTWADEFYGTIDSSGDVWGVDFVINNYGGPGVYKDNAIDIQVHNSDNTKVWLRLDGDTATFTLDRTQESGTVDALLTNAGSGKAGALHLTGRWNCKA
ncbi:MAG TPA: hypothetical protein VKV73_01015 [Chloroflexota bacterium]|nr:hypothetical protein [Chloroflexota bacterium]